MPKGAHKNLKRPRSQNVVNSDFPGQVGTDGSLTL